LGIVGANADICLDVSWTVSDEFQLYMISPLIIWPWALGYRRTVYAAIIVIIITLLIGRYYTILRYADQLCHGNHQAYMWNFNFTTSIIWMTMVQYLMVCHMPCHHCM
jgi:peptidoglycan/LPS O-acetylase OafA/YrhL